MCPHYERLQEIFGKRRSTEMDVFDSEVDSTEFFTVMDPVDFVMPVIDYTDVIIENADPEQVVLLTDSEDVLHRSSTPQINNNNETESRQCVSSAHKADKVASFSEKLKERAPKNAIDQLAKCQAERNRTMSQRLKFEEEKFKLEMEFNKEKFNAEMEMRREDNRIQILQIEKDERIAKYELDLKYKNKQ